MDVIAFGIGLSIGLAFAALLVQRVRLARAEQNAARALERDAATDLVVARERHAAEIASLEKELAGADVGHSAEMTVLRERFAMEVTELRRAVSDARAETIRAQDIEHLVERVSASVDRVEQELRRVGRGRQRHGGGNKPRHMHAAA